MGGSMVVACEVPPDNLEKCVMVEHTETPMTSRSLLAGNRMTMMIPIGVLVVESRDYTFPLTHMYQQPWAVGGSLVLFNPSLLLSDTFLPASKDNQGGLASMYRRTPCCSNVQLAEITFCTGCGNAFVFMTFDHRLYSPLHCAYISDGKIVGRVVQSTYDVLMAQKEIKSKDRVEQGFDVEPEEPEAAAASRACRSV